MAKGPTAFYFPFEIVLTVRVRAKPVTLDVQEKMPAHAQSFLFT